MVPLPIAVVPSKKVTMPEGLPVAGAWAATLTLKVIVCPKTTALSEPNTADVVESALLTV